MAVKGNNSSEKTVREKAIYTGLADCKVLMVNPTKDELSKIGVNLEKEPAYIIDKEDGKKSVRFDFWVQAQTTDNLNPQGKLTLWMDSDIYVGKTAGKTQFINKYGKTGWGMSSSECGQYFLQEGARPAYKGEEVIHKFLQAFLNVIFSDKTKDECLLENPQAFLSGNFSEIKGIINSWKDNTVRLLWGKDANGYQVIYPHFFEKTCIRPNYTKWAESLDGQYTQFKADFQDSLTFQAYIDSPDIKVVSPDAEKIVTTEDQF